MCLLPESLSEHRQAWSDSNLQRYKHVNNLYNVLCNSSQKSHFFANLIYQLQLKYTSMQIKGQL